MTALGVSTLAGRYRMEHLIATGGMGEVWRATDLVLNRTVAVKTLKAEHVDDQDFRERFRAEARHAGGLSHPGIASVYDYGEQEGPGGSSAWLVMELVEGEPLSEVLRRSPLGVERTLDVVAQVARALCVAHAAGVVHRDVKPGNLLLRPDGVVKVTDFGIAHAGDALPLTQTGTVVGTAYYLSPEQALGERGTPASDVYSLGVVAYECLSGCRPFPGVNPVAIASAHLREQPPPLPATVPERVRDLVLAMLAKDPDARPAGAAAVARLAEALRTAVSDGTDLAQVPGLPQAPAAVTARVHLPTAGSRAVPLGVAPEQARAVRHRSARRLALALLSVVALALGARSCLAVDDVLVPQLAAGVDATAAAVQLRNAGLQPGQRAQASQDVAAGTVVGTEPVAGTRVPEGAAVTVLVSSGRPDAVVDPAALVGRPLAEVRKALRAAGLVPVVARDGSGWPAGVVAGVQPTGSVAAGSQVVVHAVPPALASSGPVPVGDVPPTPGAGPLTPVTPAPAPTAAPTPVPASVPAAVATRTATAAPTATDGGGGGDDDDKEKGKGGGKGGGNAGGGGNGNGGGGGNGHGGGGNGHGGGKGG